MDNNLIYYILLGILLGLLTAGSLYHFKMRIQCVYLVRLTKQSPIYIIFVIVFALFFFVLSTSSENSWIGYLILTAASLFFLSIILAEGIHDKGIITVQDRGLLPNIKWEDIKYANVKKSDDYTVLTFKYISRLAGSRQIKQYYSLEDFEGIDEYIKKKVSSLAE